MQELIELLKTYGADIEFRYEKRDSLFMGIIYISDKLSTETSHVTLEGLIAKLMHLAKGVSWPSIQHTTRLSSQQSASLKWRR